MEIGTLRRAVLAFVIVAAIASIVMVWGCQDSGDDGGASRDPGDDDDDSSGGGTGSDDDDDDDDECRDAAEELYIGCTGGVFIAWPYDVEEFVDNCRSNESRLICYMGGCYKEPSYFRCEDLVCCALEICAFEVEPEYAGMCYGWEP